MSFGYSTDTCPIKTNAFIFRTSWKSDVDGLLIVPNRKAFVSFQKRLFSVQCEFYAPNQTIPWMAEVQVEEQLKLIVSQQSWYMLAEKKDSEKSSVVRKL